MVRDELKRMSIDALKRKDMVTRTRLSGVLARFLEEEKSGNHAGWTDESERAVVSKYVKTLEASLGELGGTPLAQAYQAEIDLLRPFLPQVMDEAATRALVHSLAPNVKGLGQLMGLVMKEHKGKVDAGLVRTIGAELGLK
jgi:uncharacterized protein YqeY